MGALALVDALKTNTSVTKLDYKNNRMERYASNRKIVDKLTARNARLRKLFLFDAQQMLLSVMCADLCGVVWPYVFDEENESGRRRQPLDKIDVGLSSDEVEAIRAEFAAVVEERQCRAAAALRHSADLAAGIDRGGRPSRKRRRPKRSDVEG
jgi:hypothetical protein